MRSGAVGLNLWLFALDPSFKVEKVHRKFSRILTLLSPFCTFAIYQYHQHRYSRH